MAVLSSYCAVFLLLSKIYNQISIAFNNLNKYHQVNYFNPMKFFFRFNFMGKCYFLKMYSKIQNQKTVECEDDIIKIIKCV